MNERIAAGYSPGIVRSAIFGRSLHTSRKGYLTTAVATRPEDYVRFASDLMEHDGCIGLESRFAAMQHCSEDLARYYNAISDFVNELSVDDIRRAYPTVHNTK